MTRIVSLDISRPATRRPLQRRTDLANYAAPLGRALYSMVFLASAPNHFSPQTIEYARRQGVPMPGVLVPLSGVLALAGGLSVLLGFRAKAGGWMLAGFLAPVTAMMHRFWAAKEPQERQNQQIHFMKNLALLGGALLISRCGADSLSLDHMVGSRRSQVMPTIL